MKCKPVTENEIRIGTRNWTRKSANQTQTDTHFCKRLRGSDCVEQSYIHGARREEVINGDDVTDTHKNTHTQGAISQAHRV